MAGCKHRVRRLFAQQVATQTSTIHPLVENASTSTRIDLLFLKHNLAARLCELGPANCVQPALDSSEWDMDSRSLKRGERDRVDSPPLGPANRLDE
jgi:hypothetical protein